MHDGAGSVGMGRQRNQHRPVPDSEQCRLEAVGRLFADSNLSSDATFGGLVAVVEGTCTASPVIKKYQ